MTQTAYLAWMERKIVMESRLLDHSKWPCRKKQWNNGAAKNEGNRLQYVENENYHRSDEEFFIINEMMNNDETVKYKKLFILYIKMDEPNSNNKDVASVAWTPLAKVVTTTHHPTIVSIILVIIIIIRYVI